MARASRLIFQPTHQQRGDGAIAGDYIVVNNRDWRPAVFEFIQTSPGLLLTQFEEGVDFPFLPHRFQSYQDVYQRIWSTFRTSQAQSSQISSIGLGSAYALLFSPPADPFPTQEIYPFPFAAAARRWVLRHWLPPYMAMAAPSAYLPALPANVYTVPVCELLDEIQFHLLEIANFGASFDSNLWTIEEILNYLNLRTYRFLLETNVIQQRTTFGAPAGIAEVDLPTDLIAIKRVAWTRAGATNELPRQDQAQIDSWIPDWQTAGAADPAVYSEALEPSLQVQLAPVPTNPGTVDLIYVARTSEMTNNCDIFPLPDEWTAFIKYGVMADMLAKEGEANDPERAQYCESRYDEGVALARLLLGVLGE